MERESFEDEEVANLLNQNFISIKVDREERPDIDTVYMKVCQMITHSGGWPLSIFLTPAKEPFYAGTYFPKRNMYGRIGFIELLTEIKKQWSENQETIIKQASDLTSILHSKSDSSDIPEQSLLNEAYSQLKEKFIEEHGGFTKSPKFPTPHNLFFLMEYGIKNQKKAIDMCICTLDSMFKGGIYDHIGGGFSRYSTDYQWLVPHFEKMLYDNALLIQAYTYAYLITKKPYYKIIVEDTVEWIKRDMLHEKGGFYSALDADSEGVEGKYYVWTLKEVENILEQDEYDIFSKLYNLSYSGNFEGKNIPNLINTELDSIYSDNEMIEKVANIKNKLLKKRYKRIPPHKDDKILVSWNGLMISALAYASVVFEREDYMKMAVDSANFIQNELTDDNNRLMVSYREEVSKQKGFLDDYAFFILGLITLYETTLDIQWLSKAIEYTDDMINMFQDEENGGFYLYGNDSEQLITRPKEAYDGAVPSGNSVASIILYKLSHITEREEYRRAYEGILKSFSKEIKDFPMYYTYMLITILNLYQPSANIVIAGEKNEISVKKFLQNIYQKPFSFTTIVLNDKSQELANINQNILDNKQINGNTAFYVCHNFTCNVPEADYKKALEQLNK